MLNTRLLEGILTAIVIKATLSSPHLIGWKVSSVKTVFCVGLAEEILTVQVTGAFSISDFARLLCVGNWINSWEVPREVYLYSCSSTLLSSLAQTGIAALKVLQYISTKGIMLIIPFFYLTSNIKIMLTKKKKRHLLCWSYNTEKEK